MSTAGVLGDAPGYTPSLTPIWTGILGPQRGFKVFIDQFSCTKLPLDPDLNLNFDPIGVTLTPIFCLNRVPRGTGSRLQLIINIGRCPKLATLSAHDNFGNLSEAGVFESWLFSSQKI